MDKPTTLLALLALLSAAGCVPREQTSASTYGEAVRHNMAAQIVDPDPPDLEIPPADGVRTALMRDRYQTDKVSPPEESSLSGIGLSE